MIIDYIGSNYTNPQTIIVRLNDIDLETILDGKDLEVTLEPSFLTVVVTTKQDTAPYTTLPKIPG